MPTCAYDLWTRAKVRIRQSAVADGVKPPHLPQSKAYLQSESFPIAYIVHYMPFTVQEILHREQETDLSRSVYL